tara:strand:- start:129 stop:2336 length:2208 start_codon:yes stop_codon:yes gene_type:complete
MALNLASPGILIREVDLTIGRIDGTTGKVAGIVGPFAKGPVDNATPITGENDLFDQFGQPYDTDKQYETWMVASSYLAYGGSLSVIRADDAELKNGFVGSGTSLKIKSTEHYQELGYQENALSTATLAARNPGTWSNGIKVAIIDGIADQILDLSAVGIATTVTAGVGITQTVPASTVVSGAGGTSLLDGYFKGIVTQKGPNTSAGLGTDQISVKFISHVSAAGTETSKDFNSIYKFATDAAAQTEVSTGGTITVTGTRDWFDQQTYDVTTASVGGGTTTVTAKWNAIAEKPSTSDYVSERGGRFDEVHVVVIDAKGTISGNAGTVLEKHLNLSKAKDAMFSVGSPSYWRKYLYTNSENIFGLGGSIIGITTTGFAGANFTEFGDGGWDQDAEGIVFNSCGKTNLEITKGTNYGGISTITSTGALDSGLGDLIAGYQKFESDTVDNVDFLLMGSGKYGQDSTRQLATTLISVAELRKDAVAFISPARDRIISDTTDDTAVTILDDETITTNVVNFYDTITSSTFAVFDSGYKYMYDRFNEVFRYVPLNGDIAGTCARNDINDFPWFSPAGTDRGAILNAVKLPYNPTRLQRDKLYSNRINPVINSPGAGIILFGDKTGFAKASAFDRINVRRLFIYLENGIAAAAKDQLFEFNDEITRANFVNIVEPFLRDVQSKRGIQDYVVVCDETNNTASVIDNNEFIADIFVKPARSINFIGLTFVATRSGVSFEEVIGSV